MADYDAILLTGGSARRLGGRDKPALAVGGVPIAARVAAAVADAERLVVVGPCPACVPADVVTREDPPGGGPVAGVIAGLSHVERDWVAVLAGDLPFVTAATVRRLAELVRTADVALLVDSDGRDQQLCALWRTEALRTAVTGFGAGSPMRAVLAAASRVQRLAVPTDGPPPWFDCDTEDDLARAREWAD